MHVVESDLAPGTSCSIVETTSDIATSGPPRLKTVAPFAGVRAAAMKARATSAVYWSCVRPPNAML